MSIFSLLSSAALRAATNMPQAISTVLLGHPGGPPHLPRGQGPAREIIVGPAKLFGDKTPSRRDQRRLVGRAVAYRRTKDAPRGDHRGSD